MIWTKTIRWPSKIFSEWRSVVLPKLSLANESSDFWRQRRDTNSCSIFALKACRGAESQSPESTLWRPIFYSLLSSWPASAHLIKRENQPNGESRKSKSRVPRLKTFGCIGSRTITDVSNYALHTLVWVLSQNETNFQFPAWISVPSKSAMRKFWRSLLTDLNTRNRIGNKDVNKTLPALHYRRFPNKKTLLVARSGLQRSKQLLKLSLQP